VKKYLLPSAVAAALFVVIFAGNCLMCSSAPAQQPYPPASAQSPGAPLPAIALVDVGYIFKKHARLNAERKALTAEADKLQKDFEDQARAVQEKGKQLAAYKPGSPEYNKLEAEIVAEQSAIKTSITAKRREFIQREAHLMYIAYIEIRQEVRAFCDARGIALALSFDHEALREDNPNDVARGISNPVVYYNKLLDITPDVVQRFARDLPANPAGPAAFIAPQTR
jgi:Skp family chaperone for outer membrane proteins